MKTILEAIAVPTCPKCGRFVKREEVRVTVAPQGIVSLLGAVPASVPQDFKKAREAAMEDRINEKHARD